MYQKVLNLNVEVIPILPSGPQALGWFKKPIKSLVITSYSIHYTKLYEDGRFEIARVALAPLKIGVQYPWISIFAPGYREVARQPSSLSPGRNGR